MLHDVAGHLSSSSSHSSIDIIPDDSPSPSNAPTLKADSPPSAQQGLHKPQHRSRHGQPPPNTSSAYRQAEQRQQQQQQSPQPVFLNPFAAAAVQLHSPSSDSDLSLEKDAAESSAPAAATVLRSPKATRTHVQHALEDGDVQEVVAEAAAPMTAQMRLSMERAHSAGQWAASRHVIGPIPEDRAVGSSPPHRGMHVENRPIRKVLRRT